ncbi:4058_t:CDS:2, partial [Racocetra persica]
YQQGIWYIDAKLGLNTCNNLMKSIYNDVGINIENRDIVNHSGRTTLITFLFREGVPIVTSMSIRGHKNESSYRIYSRPSEQQKKNALSTLINAVNLPEAQDLPSDNNHDTIYYHDTIHNYDTIHDHDSVTIHDHDSDTIQNYDTIEENTDQDTADEIQMKVYSRRRSLRRKKWSSQDSHDSAAKTGTTIINNYYINADHVTINK